MRQGRLPFVDGAAIGVHAPRAFAEPVDLFTRRNILATFVAISVLNLEHRRTHQ